MTDTIYTPRFTLTPQIASGIADIERRAWLIENMLIMPRQEVWIRRGVAIRRASGTTSLEGVGLPEQEIADLINRRIASSDDEAEQANLNAIRAYEFVDYVSDQPDVPIDALVIRELNRQFMHGASEVLTPGSYRRGQNRIGRFTPPDQGDVPALMRALAVWLRQLPEAMSPVVAAGLAHIHFVAVHPFWDGNGRTARALAALVLQRSPLHFKKLLSFEHTFAANRDEYIAAIEQTLGETFAESYDATPWLEFFVSGIEVASSMLEDQLTDWNRAMSDLRTTVADLRLKERQVDALAYAAQVQQLTRKDYMEVTGVKALTATRDLADLVARGLLVAQGRTRDRTYSLPKPPA